MSGPWQQRVRQAPGTHHLHAAQDAARNLADHAGCIFPGKGRIVFQTVCDVAVLGTVVISGTLAAVHLWKALAPRHNEQHSPEVASGGGMPPRRPSRWTASAADHDGRMGRGQPRRAERDI